MVQTSILSDDLYYGSPPFPSVKQQSYPLLIKGIFQLLRFLFTRVEFVCYLWKVSSTKKFNTTTFLHKYCDVCFFQNPQYYKQCFPWNLFCEALTSQLWPHLTEHCYNYHLPTWIWAWTKCSTLLLTEILVKPTKLAGVVLIVFLTIGAALPTWINTTSHAPKTQGNPDKNPTIYIIFLYYYYITAEVWQLTLRSDSSTLCGMVSTVNKTIWN